MPNQDKNHKEFYELIKPHMKSLKNTAFRLSRNEQESEDLLQEALYKAYRGFHSFTPNTNFRAWIFKILVNTYLTYYRKMIKQPQKVSYGDLEEFYIYQKSENESEYHSNSPENISGESFGDEIKETLDKMPYYFRIVVTLYDIEGFSYKEISNMINIPVGTVMSRLNRGRGLLRQKLGRYARDKGYPVRPNLNPEFAQ
jgi:RNA polymerase sigma-70 factor (ECF subfamily)